ncbi:hypothetical protein FYC77_18495 [Natrialba swarupiae]|uniref:Uncharacterized protein n=1 Tax=Natrialba swarupiae TaxID=2448032 RepID=A0A5D5AN44_9EURY|nr:hypothetical protein [Natrialba swarupiae]TYT60521.1 hypothetical protein FYC77_18495 [Natrialba swarupiae]
MTHRKPDGSSTTASTGSTSITATDPSSDRTRPATRAQAMFSHRNRTRLENLIDEFNTAVIGTDSG